MAFFAVGLTLINICLWIIFLVKFKKIFSTDDIVAKTRNQMNRMITDIDQATDRNMYLVRESTKNIRSLLNEADKKMQDYQNALLRLNDKIAFSEKAGKSVLTQSLYEEKKTQKPVRKNITNPQIEKYIQNQKALNQANPDRSFEVTQKDQPDLFTVDDTKSVLKDETIITTEGAAYKEVPLIITEIYDDKPASMIIENSIPEKISEKSLREKVIDLYNEGYKSEEIAQALSCSVTEVDFIIDML